MINTALTYSVFLTLTYFTDLWISYTVAYVFGLAWTSFMSSSWVFQSKPSMVKILSFSVMHTLLFLLGQSLIFFLSPETLFDLLVLTVLLVSFSVPISFLTGKRIFTSRNQTAKIR
jgi:hypothetical protein